MLTLIVETNRPRSNTSKVANIVERTPHQSQAAGFVEFVECVKGINPGHNQDSLL